MLHGQDDVLGHEVVYRNGKAYYNGKPLTGTVYSDEEAPNECQCISKISYAGGVLHGWKKEWYANGKPKFSGKFSHGKPVGTHVYYYESGKVKKKEKYVNGTLTERTLYYSNGNPKKKEKYANGNLISATLYNRDGTPKGGTEAPAKTSANQQVRHNISTGKKTPTQAKPQTQNLPVNPTAEADVNSLPDGLHRFYFADGKTKRVIVKSEGLLIKDSLFYPSGNLKKVLKYNFGELIHTEEYNSDGKLLREQNFSNNKKHGLQIENFPDGSPHIRAVYESGLLVKKEEYNQNGHLVSEENYSLGKPDGPHKKFDSSGNLVELKEYDSGRLLRHERYKDGQKQVLENINGDIYKVKVYDQQGRLLKTGKLHIATDIKEGKWIYYEPETGLKRKEEFYVDGKLSYFGNYSNNRKEGVWVYYSDDGQKEKRVQYKNGNAIDSTVIRYDLQIKKHYKDGDYLLFHKVYTGKKKNEYVIVRFTAANTTSRKYIKNEILKAFRNRGFGKAEYDNVKEEELRGVITFDTLKLRVREREGKFITLISFKLEFQDWANGKNIEKEWVISPVTDNNPYLKNYYRLDKKKAFFETLKKIEPTVGMLIDELFPLEGLARIKQQSKSRIEEVYLNLNNTLVKYGDYFEVPEAGKGEVLIKVIEAAPSFSVGSVTKGGEKLKALLAGGKKIPVRKKSKP